MRQSFMVPTADHYAKLGIGWIGHAEAVVSPYWPHAAQGWAMGCLPESVVVKLITNMHKAIRKKGIAKDRRLAEEGKKD